MNIQTPWVFYTSAMPTHPHHHHPGANKAQAAANAAAAAAGLIPINCPPGATLLPPTAAGITPNPYGAFTPAPTHHHHHPHPHHHSQLLLAAAAAAYGQQCAAATHLLHQQHQPQIPNGNYHLKVHKVNIYMYYV
jgi:hypothetical protein